LLEAGAEQASSPLGGRLYYRYLDVCPTASLVVARDVRLDIDNRAFVQLWFDVLMVTRLDRLARSRGTCSTSSIRSPRPARAGRAKLNQLTDKAQRRARLN
jgi:hypothetical protein